MTSHPMHQPDIVHQIVEFPKLMTTIWTAKI